MIYMIYILLVLALLYIEYINKLRPNKEEIKPDRFLINFYLVVINTLISKIILLKILNKFENFQFVHLNFLGIFKIIIFLPLIDFVYYYFHKYQHQNKFLFKFHSTHHSDIELDVGTGFRFHPIEIILSTLIFTPLILIGLNVEDYLYYDSIVTLIVLISHSNIKLPIEIEQKIMKYIVTPNFHQVHHSKSEAEQNSNFGFLFTYWDNHFKTATLNNNIKEIGLANQNQIIPIIELLKKPFKN